MKRHNNCGVSVTLSHSCLTSFPRPSPSLSERSQLSGIPAAQLRPSKAQHRKAILLGDRARRAARQLRDDIPLRINYRGKEKTLAAALAKVRTPRGRKSKRRYMTDAIFRQSAEFQPDSIRVEGTGWK